MNREHTFYTKRANEFVTKKNESDGLDELDGSGDEGISYEAKYLRLRTPATLGRTFRLLNHIPFDCGRKGPPTVF